MTEATNIYPSALGEWTNGRGSAFGWSFSTLVHAMIIAWLWHASSHHPAGIDTQQERRMAVWLVPVPVPTPLPAITTTASVATVHPIRSPNRKERLPRSGAMPSMPAVPQSLASVAAQPAPAAETEPAKLAGGEASTFDMAAARSSARAIAREDSKGVAATVLRQEATGARTTGQIQQRLEQARRGNCLKANESMNLLANVVMLARDIVATAVDDSGCKW